MYGVSPQAYDRAITVFSPDGRLFQVEYAKEAVKRGATAIGMAGADSVVLAAYKSAGSKLMVSESLKKIFFVDDHIAVTASGLIADARRLVDIARTESQKHRLTYNENSTVELITRSVCDLMQIYTQYGGIRPFGVSLLIAGIDDKPRLYEAEPSGAMTGFYADSIGNGKKTVDEFLEKNFKPDLSLDDTIGLCIQGLKKTTEKRLSAENVEIAYATTRDKKFRTLEDRALAKYLK